jgi:hypothetical protein
VNYGRSRFIKSTSGVPHHGEKQEDSGGGLGSPEADRCAFYGFFVGIFVGIVGLLCRPFWANPFISFSTHKQTK